MGTHPIFESDFDCLTEKMKDFSKLLVRELQAELKTRDIEFGSKERKAILQEKLRKYFTEKYPDVNIDELDFSDKVRFFKFENEERSRNASRESSATPEKGEEKAEMTLVEEDLNMTPTKDLKKQQPRLYDAILKKAKGREEMGS